MLRAQQCWLPSPGQGQLLSPEPWLCQAEVSFLVGLYSDLCIKEGRPVHKQQTIRSFLSLPFAYKAVTILLAVSSTVI